MSNKQMMEFSIQIIVIRFQATAISYGGFRHNFNERVPFGEGSNFLRHSSLPYETHTPTGTRAPLHRDDLRTRFNGIVNIQII